MTERTRLCRLVAQKADQRDEARDAARSLLARAQFADPEERLRFIEKHPWLKETPEERYRRVLAWVDGQLAEAAR